MKRTKRYQVRPGKLPAVTGLVVSVFFVLLGVLVVIPGTGLFGIVWTGIAVVNMIIYATHVRSSKDMISSEIIVEDEERETDREDRTEERADAETSAERLRAAEELYQQGLITYEEYQKKRAEIIDSI